MATVKHAAYGSIASALTTELNTLANNANSALSSAIDNTSALDLFVDLELNLGTQTARSSGATVEVYLVQSVDGTNYGAGLESIDEMVAVFTFDAATTARRATRKDIPIPPALYKLFVRNRTGQSFAASGNTLKYRPHNISVA